MRPGHALSRSLVDVDRRGIDGLVEALARLVGGSSNRIRQLQNGFARSYALSVFIGATLVVAAMALVRLW